MIYIITTTEKNREVSYQFLVRAVSCNSALDKGDRIMKESFPEYCLRSINSRPFDQHSDSFMLSEKPLVNGRGTIWKRDIVKNIVTGAILL